MLLRDTHQQVQRLAVAEAAISRCCCRPGRAWFLLDDDLRLPLRRPEFAAGGLDPDPGASALLPSTASMEDALGSGTEINEDPFEGCIWKLAGRRSERA